MNPGSEGTIGPSTRHSYTRQVAIIGSTGSIGQNALKVIDHLGEHLQVRALAANRSVKTLAAQVARYAPGLVALRDAQAVDMFRQECRSLGIGPPEILVGSEGLCAVAEMDGVDVVLAAVVGAAGLESTHAALQAGKCVALANKEVMVIAGGLLKTAAETGGGVIIPVDSEHSAIDQCLRSGKREEVKRLILTASGGPFRDTPASVLASVSTSDALKHPTWKMGRRISIDSATLMNKGFEVIEAHHLFGIPATSIDIVVHPQSIVHSMVEYIDGSVVAQLGTTDMRGPIQYALSYPDRLPSPIQTLDWSRMPALEFDLPDGDRFPSIAMAYRAIEMGGTAPTVLNAADEVAVDLFLKGRIRFIDIPSIVGDALGAHTTVPADSLEQIFQADRWARDNAASAPGRLPAR